MADITDGIIVVSEKADGSSLPFVLRGRPAMTTPEIGTAVWGRFGKRPKEDTLWYYRELANAFQRLLPGQLAEELIEIVIVLENG